MLSIGKWRENEAMASVTPSFNANVSIENGGEVRRTFTLSPLLESSDPSPLPLSAFPVSRVP
jgi:hypothetical protein